MNPTRTIGLAGSLILAASVVFLAMLLAAKPANAATFTVNSVGDIDDFDPGNRSGSSKVRARRRVLSGGLGRRHVSGRNRSVAPILAAIVNDRNVGGMEGVRPTDSHHPTKV